ncbi:MAG: thiamine diphosphokinase [Butyrivibrio sp.]|nr:thiamine diphosphokinase [Butyrivibrio sp.]
MRILVITGGSFDYEFAVSFLSQNKSVYDRVIAVDNGLSYAERLGIRPDLIIGDMDTRGRDGLDGYLKKGVKIIALEPEKDDTDTERAVREAVKLGGDIDILCATGGRLDHFLASVHNLKIALDAGLNAKIIDRGNTIFLKNKSFTVSRKEYGKKYISFIAFAGEVTGIKLKGFKYPLDGYTLKPGSSRCISNELVGETGFVEFDGGRDACLIAINSSDVKPE